MNPRFCFPLTFLPSAKGQGHLKRHKMAEVMMSYYFNTISNFTLISWEACKKMNPGRGHCVIFMKGMKNLNTLHVMSIVKGATSQVAGRPTVLDQTVIVLDRTVKTIYGVLSFPSAWRWVRPSLVTSHYETHQCTGPPNSLLSQWWQICL